MIPADLGFCIHTVGQTNGYKEVSSDFDDVNIITLCPVVYWQEHKCLPDYYFANEISDSIIPSQYSWCVFVEETQWICKKSKEEIKKELSSLGFTELLEMEQFLSECWT